MTGRTHPPDRTTDRLVDLLLDADRRHVLACIAERTEPIELHSLALDLATTVEGSSVDQEVDRVALRLHHVHLPKLSDAGLVEYDAERRVVALDRDGDWATPYLELARRISTGV